MVESGQLSIHSYYALLLLPAAATATWNSLGWWIKDFKKETRACFYSQPVATSGRHSCCCCNCCWCLFVRGGGGLRKRRKKKKRRWVRKKGRIGTRALLNSWKQQTTRSNSRREEEEKERAPLFPRRWTRAPTRAEPSRVEMRRREERSWTV